MIPEQHTENIDWMKFDEAVHEESLMQKGWRVNRIVKIIEKTKAKIAATTEEAADTTNEQPD